MKRKEKDGVAAKPERRPKIKTKSSDLVSVSLVIFLLDTFTDWIYRCLRDGFFGRIFTAYSSEQAAFERGAFRHYFKASTKFRGYLRRIREWLSNAFESSLFLGKLQSAMQGLQTMPLRAYGNFWMSFGIYTILIYFIRMFLPFSETANLGFLITGIVISVASLPLVTARGSFSSAILKSRIVRSLCMDVFGFREEILEKKAKKKPRTSWLILLGILCGMLTFVIHPLYIPIAVVGLVALFLIFSTPEIGLCITLFILPFLSIFSSPTLALGILVLITFFAYALKLVRGKRMMRFELYDLMIVIFGIIIFLGGTISAGGTPSFRSALISCALMLGYFLVVNLIRTKEWVSRCFGTLVSSATIVALLGVLQYLFNVFGSLNRSTLDLSQFSDIKGRVTVLFENPNILGFYLAMIFPLALYMFLDAPIKKRTKIPSLCACMLILLCLVFTWSRGAWLACLISTLIFFLIYSRKTLRYVLALLIALPLLAFLLPDNIRRRFLSIGSFSDSSTVYRVYTWQGTWDAIENFLFGGVGYGTETYAAVYPHYAYAGMEMAEHSHNLFLQIWFSLGIFALLVFLFVVWLFLQRNLETLKISSDSSMRLMTAATLCAGIAMLVMGLFDYVWYSYRIFFLFWILVGLTAAISRVDAAERQRKDWSESEDAQHATMDLNL